MVRFWLVALLISSVPNVRAEETQPSDSKFAWGIAAGAPQLLAVTLETPRHGKLRLQASVSPLLLINSVTGRAAVTRSSGTVRPYAYGGGGLLNVSEGDGGGALGTTGFLWAGGGIAAPWSRYRWYGELGVLWGMDTDKGFESAIGALAVGLWFGR
jgi:hypothetical protein